MSKNSLALMLAIFPVFCLAEDNFLHTMVQGNYLLVGKALDSDETFYGKVKIEENKGKLVVVRNINDDITMGTGAIESALNGDAKVLRIRFTSGSNTFEQTCMVSSDLDNYARISCYVYQFNVTTTQPGLEVLFHDHTAK